MSLVGQVGVKIAGRDAGEVGVVTQEIDPTYVIFTNSTRAKKCNKAHIEFIQKQIELKKGASQKDTLQALQKAGFTIKINEKKKEKKQKSAKPQQKRKAGKLKVELVKEPKKAKKKTA